MSTNVTDMEPPSYSTCDEVSARCPVEATLYGDYFTKGACVFFAVAYGLLLAAQAFLGWRSKAWSFVSYLAIGTIFELSGYAARAVLSDNPWTFGAFVVQNLFLILGPTLVAASISVTFKHLVLRYGAEYSLLRPSLYPWVFVGTDFLSIVIQSVGGSVAAFATSGGEGSETLSNVSSALLVAGVVFQVVNMVVCGGLMVIYAWRYRRGRPSRPVGSALEEESSEVGVRSTRGEKGRGGDEGRLRIFMWAITIAYVAIIIRCIYRVPEMAGGWGSDLMQNEVTFLILDGAMILLAVLLLTVFHPAYFFPTLGKQNARERLGSLTGRDAYEMQ
ncbi:Uncharacterized protein C17G6.02c 2 [Colletotrichum chlorophyti]|uniref:Uncharacterized protein C17G6.02c 2 n=1 Tax=Colletotrichum chlorophyti TaxID=708187 RepID=A0A1Q8RRI4_9PEZI|nr:Uncharacterized protein C17G6.02c 2 [Colletotrichum chlorophyti]